MHRIVILLWSVVVLSAVEADPANAATRAETFPPTTVIELPMPGAGATEAELDGPQPAFMAISVPGGRVGIFVSRVGGGKKRAIGKYGGSKASETAVNAGLQFLKRHQGPEGSWSPSRYHLNCTEEPKCEPGAGDVDDQIVMTTLASLAFLGSGYDHKTPNEFKTTMAKALTWLQTQQQDDGSIGTTIAAQAGAVQALAEVIVLSGDPALKAPTQRCLDRLLSRRIAGTDGMPWAWGSGITADTADTVAAIMAMISAQSANLEIGDGLDRAKHWLDTVWKASNPTWLQVDPLVSSATFPARWSATIGPEGDETEAGASVAVFLGRGAGDLLLESLVNHLAQDLDASRRTDLRRLYLGGRAVFTAGGDRWTTWNQAYRDALVASQDQTSGCAMGSWSPAGQTALRAERGRLQSTIYALLHGELYYTYAPQTHAIP